MDYSTNKINLSREQVKETIETCRSIGECAIKLGIDRRTFKKIALEYDLYTTRRKAPTKKFELVDILAGLHPQYPTSKLSRRLVAEGYKPYACECCGIATWMAERISLELNHKDETVQIIASTT